jgi:hypothetical protein
MRKPIALVVVLTAVIATAATAQTAPMPPAWKWRDAAGQVHVSDLPPPLSVPAKDILDRPPLQRKVAAAEAAATSAAAAPLNTGPKTDPELEARRKRAADEQAAQQRQQQDRDLVLRADNCSRAKGALAGLAEGQRMTRTNAKGEREVLDDKERADEMQRARAVIASDCR